MTPDDLAYIKDAIARSKPVSAKRVAALLAELEAARAEIERLTAELAAARVAPQRSPCD